MHSVGKETVKIPSRREACENLNDILYKKPMVWYCFGAQGGFTLRANRSGFMRPTYNVNGAVGWGTALQAGKSQVRFPMLSLEIFHWHNPSGCSMNLGLTQPLTEMSTRNIYEGGGGKFGQCVGLTTLVSSCVDCFEIWKSHPPGTIRACPGQYRDWFIFTNSVSHFTTHSQLDAQGLSVF